MRDSDVQGTLLLIIIWTAIVLILACPSSCSLAHAEQTPPIAAQRYQRDLIRTARYVWGMRAPIAVLAAQVHQESGWDPSARSAYASGLAQFTPATARDITRRHVHDLAQANPLDPRWALMALCHYDREIWLTMAFTATDADRWAFTLSAYNGGPGWVARDRAAARAKGLDPARWWGQTERVNAGRAFQFWAENRDYPRKILITRQPLYRSWGPGVDIPTR